jgi:hypothetical protein
MCTNGGIAPKITPRGIGGLERTGVMRLTVAFGSATDRAARCFAHPVTRVGSYDGAGGPPGAARPRFLRNNRPYSDDQCQLAFPRSR